MSLGYADRLKQRRNLGGQLGAKEYHQSFDDINSSVRSLATWISDAKRVFVFTGAGISTSCGIPDFRGPSGIWTLRKKKQPLPTNFTPFEYAKPSFTHMAISALVASGKVPHVCSQNVDSLHLWSGVPRAKLAELHGNCFAERCTMCRTEYARDFQMETVDFKPSGRTCRRPGCGGPLVDNILDWETPLPEDELNEAVQQAEEADVALVLGTSLQIQPANEIPVLTRDDGGKMVIVNLQKTPKDRKAHLIIRGRVDLVMALLVQQLGLKVPPYIRTEVLVVEHQLSQPAAAGGGRSLMVSVRSRHGPGCPLPMMESVTISVSAGFTSHSAAATAAATTSAAKGRGAGCQGSGDQGASTAREWGPHSSGVLPSTSPPASETPAASSSSYSHTFAGIPDWVRTVRCTLHVRLVKWADEDKRDVVLQHEVELEALPGTAGSDTGTTGAKPPSETPPSAHTTHGAFYDDAASPSTRIHTFVSQQVEYDPEAVITAFREDPPAVVLPEPPRKRHKGQADGAAAPAAVPTRTSTRVTRVTAKAVQYAAGTDSSSTDESAGSDSDDNSA